MTDPKLIIRDFDDCVRNAYRVLFPGDAEKAHDLLSWRFGRNPHGQAKFAVALEGDEVAGLIALVQTRLVNAVGEHGYQAIDTAVCPSKRGKGLFVKLGALIQSELGADVLWGFPNANAAPGWFGQLGWTNYGAVPLLMRPLRASFVLGRVHPKLTALNLRMVRTRTNAAHVYDDGRELCRDFGQLWRHVRPAYGAAVDRSGEWMKWRLFDKPGYDYRCVGSKDGSGNLKAFVAVKVVDKHGSRLCYVMEAISAPDSDRDLARLLLAELSRATREGAEAALAWCPKGGPNYGAYRRAGFLPVPATLRPIEINFGAKALRADCAAAAAPSAKWYLSFLDSDTN